MKTVRLNSKGFDVLYLQQLLNLAGYAIYDDGDFGLKTDKAVRDFQKRYGLVVDGIVGQNTWMKLINLLNMEDSRKLKEDDYIEIAKKLNMEVAVIKAVKEVESGMYGGFISPGYPPILFEGHIFWRQLENDGVYPNNYIKGNEDIIHQKWTKQYYLGGMREYDRLDKAMKINKLAALKSASWGMFQIMGFNYQACGCKTVDEFITKMKQSEKNQLEMFMLFLINNKWDKYLRDKNWAGFAAKYNGPGYAENQYDIKLERAYNKYKKEA